MKRKKKPAKRHHNLSEHFARRNRQRFADENRRLAAIRKGRQERARKMAKANRVFTDNEIRMIRQLRKDGHSYAALKTIMGKGSAMTFKRILNGETYGDVK